MFPLIFAALVMIAMAIGFNVAGWDVLVPVGIGVTATAWRTRSCTTCTRTAGSDSSAVDRSRCSIDSRRSTASTTATAAPPTGCWSRSPPEGRDRPTTRSTHRAEPSEQLLPVPVLGARPPNDLAVLRLPTREGAHRLDVAPQAERRRVGRPAPLRRRRRRAARRTRRARASTPARHGVEAPPRTDADVRTGDHSDRAGAGVGVRRTRGDRSDDVESPPRAVPAGSRQADVPVLRDERPSRRHVGEEGVERCVVLPDREQRRAAEVGPVCGAAAAAGAEQSPEAQPWCTHADGGDRVRAATWRSPPVLAHEVERGDPGHGCHAGSDGGTARARDRSCGLPDRVDPGGGPRVPPPLAVDLRAVGDRNPGYWNAKETLGRRAAVPVFLGDAAKGVAAAAIGRACRRAGDSGGSATSAPAPPWSVTPGRCSPASAAVAAC